MPLNLALSNQNDLGVFHKIDSFKTKTPWANGTYQHENYVQTPVTVQFASASHLIAAAITPQGA